MHSSEIKKQCTVCYVYFEALTLSVSAFYSQVDEVERKLDYMNLDYNVVLTIYTRSRMSTDRIYRGEDHELNDIPDLIKREVDALIGKQNKTKRNDVTDYKGQNEQEYNFNHPYRGVAVVISNGDFTLCQLRPREYAETEIKAMSKVFSMLGYIVLKFQDVKTTQMMDILRSVSKMTEFHEKSDSFACAIGSHGAEVLMKSTKDSNKTKNFYHVIYGTETFIKTEDIIRTFEDGMCKSLQGKPKLFFLQACRSRSNDASRKYNSATDVNVLTGHCSVGDQPHKDEEETGDNSSGNLKEIKQGQRNICYDYDSQHLCDDKVMLDASFKDEVVYKKEDLDRDEGILSSIKNFLQKKNHHVQTLSIPCPNHCFVAYATASGNYALGREKTGGWLFYGLVRFFEGLQFSSKVEIDLIDLITIIASAISIQMQSKTDRKETTGLKTAVCVEHRLTKSIVFRLKS